MKKALIVDNIICSGCMSCMTNCSQFHDGYACFVSSRIKVELEPFTGVHKILYCHQCEEAECAENCPEGAISFEEDLNCYIVDYGICIECQTCIDVCPHEAMFFDSNQEKVIKCDLCSGHPNCVDSCFTGALWYGVEGEEAPDKMASRYFLAEKKAKGENEDG